MADPPPTSRASNGRAPRSTTRGRRISPVPLPPSQRPEWTVLQDGIGALGLVLWRGASDAVLWSSSPAAARADLFRRPSTLGDEIVALAIREAPELATAVGTLWGIHRFPDLARAEDVGTACASVALWADGAGLNDTALHFAELAARVQPEHSGRSFTAGRLCRRRGEHQRAWIWYRRALRLGRLAGNQIDIANARLGLGNTEADVGRESAAETHYRAAARAALRNGRRSLAAAAYHNLVRVAYETGRTDEALGLLFDAITGYDVDHPRFPALLYDAAFLLLRERFFSSALEILERVLPLVESTPTEILVRSALARSAAAVRDHIRYQRQCTAVLALAAVHGPDAGYSLYQLAEGARSFGDWERARALAVRAREVSHAHPDAPSAATAERLIRAIERREPGDEDRVPAEGGRVDLLREEALRRVRRCRAPAPGDRPVPPEWYPSE